MKIQQEEKYDEPKIQHNKLIFPLEKTQNKKTKQNPKLIPVTWVHYIVFFSQSNNTNN